MSNDQYWQLEKEYYTITAPSDLVLRVVERRLITSQQGNTSVVRSVPVKVHEFKVDFATLAGGSDRFNTILEQQSGPVQLIEINENDAGNVTALAVWLKIIHYIVTADTYELHLYEVWYVCSVAEKYGFDTTAENAQNWFNSWYNHQPKVKHFNFRDYEQLLYPTLVFNHAIGFAHTTKYLAYRSNGIISEVQPEDFRADNADDIYTSPEVLVQLNAARDRLTTVLHRALYAPISKLLNDNSCNCAPYLLYSYEKGLANTGCWPLHPALQKMSMKAVLEALSQFGQVPMHTCGKEKCSMDLLGNVEKAIKDIEGQFAGLCIDCMVSSGSDTGTEQYWHHDVFGVAWDEGCRVQHTQPSWFFSFMGDRTEMNQWIQSKTLDRANSNSRDRPSSYGYGNNAFPRGGVLNQGGNTQGPRGGVRNSQRPGRQDSLLSRPHYSGGMPGQAIQDVTSGLANTTISQVQDPPVPVVQVTEDGN